MKVLTVRVWPDPVLMQRAAEVTTFDGPFESFVESMFATMFEAGGIGLAANQVGVLQRVLTMLVPKTDSDTLVEKLHNQMDFDKKYLFVNPVIIEKKNKIRWQEGCLSFPEMYEDIDRSRDIIVKAQTAKGEFFEMKASGIFAVCLQHEIDHLDGIVFIDRMSRLKAGLIKKKMLQQAQPQLSKVFENEK